ncbi:MAG: rod shape-determining protein [Actinomycetota bacterium]|nr:rod shape-determining protein [Actinomycetota bacterium]
MFPAPRGHDLAIDLGTANTVVYRRGEGVVAFEPSVVAIDEQTEAVVAIGQDARRMIGRTPASIRAIRPLRHGVIADFEVTEQMLRYFIRRGREGWLGSPRVVLCVPSGVTEVERRAVVEAAVAAGARHAYLIEEPMAGAIGAGLPVGEAAGSMVVDIGGGTSEVAVISLGGMVVSRSLRVGGYELDEAIVRHLREEQGLVVGHERAEELKIEIGAVLVGDQPLGAEAVGGSQTEVAGRDRTTGLLRRRTITAAEVGHAIERPVAQIVEATIATLEQTPPELAADVGERGLVLVGGGALLGGMAERLRRETRLPVQIADSPLTCVAIGAGRSLEEISTYERTALSRKP